MQEYMPLLLGSVVSNNSLFCGEIDSRFLRHNVIELNKKTYFHVGQILSITLVHGGPAPSFFAQPIADYILYGLDKVKISITDVQNLVIKRRSQKVSAHILSYPNSNNQLEGHSQPLKYEYFTNKQESISVPHRRLGSSSWYCTERSMQVLSRNIFINHKLFTG